MTTATVIGVLALQGNFAAHSAMLQRLNVKTVLVKLPQLLQQINGLIIPGGESTAMIKQMFNQPVWQTAFKQLHRAKIPIFGTCAGLILLSKQVQPSQFSFGWLDIEVLRNGYGRQVDSHVAHADFNVNGKVHEIEMPLIRAPKIIAIGPQVKPLIAENDDIYMVEDAQLLATTFHPEMTQQTYVHEYFLEKIKQHLTVV